MIALRRFALRPLGGAALVASGILLSRIAGFVRESVFAAYFGNSAVADAFRAALRIPNLLQNLFGEGVLSASFIPVYANLLGREQQETARRLALKVGATLSLFASLLCVFGMIFADWLVDLIAPGFSGQTRELTATLVRIFFPATAVLVLSAWCLGILNAHRKFFLSYAAPVVWNLAIIGAILIFGATSTQPELALIAAYGMVLGSLAQFLVQFVPSVRFLRSPSVDTQEDSSREHLKTAFRVVTRNFLPVLFGRGVVQISAFVDSMIASLLAVGSVATLGYMQVLYLLPISLFGMSISAAELPEMSRLESTEITILHERLKRAARRILFFIAPITVGFVLFGDLLIEVLFERGKFDQRATLVVAATLAVISLALPAATIARLFSSTFYAMKQTRPPVEIALVRVTLGSITSAILALYGSVWLGLSPDLAVLGLVAGSVGSAWLELYLLQYRLKNLIGEFEILSSENIRLGISACLAGSLAGIARLVMEIPLQRLMSDLLSGLSDTLQQLFSALVHAAVFGGLFGVLYLASVFAIVPGAKKLTQTILRRGRIADV